MADNCPIKATELHLARSSKAVRRLLERGADVDARDFRGHTPLHWARGYRCAEALIASGADIEARNGYGETPLRHAIRFGHTGAALAMIDAGADPTAADNDGEVPIISAASRGRTQILEAMIKAGADPDFRDRKNHTALWWAKDPEILRILQDAGADMDACKDFEIVIKTVQGDVIYRSVCDKNDVRKAVNLAVSEGVSLERADLRDAHLWGAKLDSAKLKGACLSGAGLNNASAKNADLRGVDFSGADLFGCRFDGSDLSGSDLTKAHTSGQKFSGVKFREAKLSGTDLSYAELDGAVEYPDSGPHRKVRFFENHLIIWHTCYTLEEWTNFSRTEISERRVHDSVWDFFTENRSRLLKWAERLAS